MSDHDFDAIFDGESKPVIEHEEPEQEQAVEVTETNEEAEPAQVAEEVSSDVSDEEEEVAHTVPLPTFLGMTDKYRDAKAEREEARREAAEYKRQLEEYQRSASKADQAPDPFQDPRGYADYRFAQLEHERTSDRIMLSGQFAARTHGQEAVAEAATWAAAQAKSDPRFDQMVASQPDPIEWVIQQHKAARQLDEFQRDPEAFARRIAEERGWLSAAVEAQAITGKPTTTAKRIVPPSLTDVPAANSATKAVPVNETADFNAIFDRKRK